MEITLIDCSDAVMQIGIELEWLGLQWGGSLLTELTGCSTSYEIPPPDLDKTLATLKEVRNSKSAGWNRCRYRFSALLRDFDLYERHPSIVALLQAEGVLDRGYTEQILEDFCNRLESGDTENDDDRYEDF